MAHAFLAPSSFARTIKCPASALRAMQVEARIDLISMIGPEFYGLKEGEESERFVANILPDTNAADEGTARHQVFEEAISNAMSEYRDILPLIEGNDLISESGKADKYINDKLITCIQEQVEFLEDAEWVSIEHKVQVKGLPQFGHVDLAAYKERTLYIKDLKTGRVDVQAENNAQLTVYAVGLVDELGWDKFDDVQLEILGLNFESSIWAIDIDDLRTYKDEVMLPTFMKAYSINPPAEAGEHCMYCPAKIHCKEWQEKFDGARNEYIDADLSDFDNDDLVSLRSKIKDSKNALDQINRVLMERAQGFNPPNVTLVKGKTITNWKDPDAVEKKLKGKAFKKVLREPKEFEPDEIEGLTTTKYGRGWIR